MVERYSVTTGRNGEPVMDPDDFGDWVTFDSYETLRTAFNAERDRTAAVYAKDLARIAALAADNEWLREGLRGIARMDPKIEGDRMVLWANDSLSGRATDLPVETKGDPLKREPEPNPITHPYMRKCNRCGKEIRFKEPCLATVVYCDIICAD